MITDACTRTWRGAEAWAAQSGFNLASSAELSAAMEGVGVAFVLGYRCDRAGAHTLVERLAAEVQQAPESRLGFAPIDPTAASAMEDLAAARELGMAGVTMSPADCGCRATDDRCMRALQWCANAGMPVLISNPGLLTPQSELEYARPSHFDEALRTMPKLRLVFGDLGRAFSEEALAMIAKHPGAFAEISTLAGRVGGLHRTLLDAYERGVMHKLLFGSGFPSETPQRAIERIFSVSSFGGVPPAAPREALRALVERDAMAALGLEHWPAARGRVNAQDALARTRRTLEVGGPA